MQATVAATPSPSLTVVHTLSRTPADGTDQTTGGRFSQAAPDLSFKALENAFRKLTDAHG